MLEMDWQVPPAAPLMVHWPAKMRVPQEVKKMSKSW